MPAPKEAPISSTPSSEEVRNHLTEMLSSPHFRRGRLEALLTHLVERALAGDRAALEESAIARAVFGRGPAFDPSTDPVVRIAGRRLRKRLAAYYSSTKRLNTPLRIELPRGGFAPVFVVKPALRRRRRVLFSGLIAAALLVFVVGATWLFRGRAAARPYESVAIVAPFRNLNGAPAFDHYGTEITKAVRDGLAKAPGIRTVRLVPGGSPGQPPEPATAVARRSGAQAVVQGSVMVTGDAVEISVELFDGRAGQRLWFEVYDNAAGQLPSVESDIVYALRRTLKLL